VPIKGCAELAKLGLLYGLASVGGSPARKSTLGSAPAALLAFTISWGFASIMCNRIAEFTTMEHVKLATLAIS